MKELPSILFVTNNAHKLSEVRAMLEGIYQVKSLADVGCHDDIPETADTIDGNAWIKARYAAGRYGIGCIADDTGLEVEALGGEPGVYSARYAGPGHDSAANVAKLLAKLDGVTDRRARFRTVIAAIIDGHEFSVSGRVDGVIAQRPSGCGGFGYDPVFIPDGHQTTFAEMGDDAKNAISHRRRAIQAFVAKLAEINRNQQKSITQPHDNKKLPAMINRILAIVLALMPLISKAQNAIGDWELFPAYQGVSAYNNNMFSEAFTGYRLLDTPDHVYYMSAGLVFDYDKAAQENNVYTKRTKLSDNTVTGLWYNYDLKYLFIAYDNGNIDLLYDDGTIVNMPDIKDAILTTTKTINDVAFNSGRIYVATSFGIVVFDSAGHYVVDSGIYNINISTIAVVNGNLVALSERALKFLPVDSRINQWSNFKQFSNFNVWGNCIRPLSGSAAVFRSYNTSDYQLRALNFNFEAGTISSMPWINESAVDYITPMSGNRYSCVSGGKLWTISPDGTTTSVDVPSVIGSQVVAMCDSPASLWTANDNGIAQFDITTSTPTVKNDYMAISTIHVREASRLRYAPSGRLYINTMHTSTTWDKGQWQYNYLDIYDGTKFENVACHNLTYYNSNNPSNYYPAAWDVMDAVEDPEDPDTYYYCTQWDGLYKIKRNASTGVYEEVTHYYAGKNAPFVYGWGCSINGVGFDKFNNMWVLAGSTCSQVLYFLPAEARKKATTEISDWTAMSFSGMNLTFDSQILVCKNSNMIFVLDADFDTSLLAYDTKGTSTLDDDTYFVWDSYTDQDGKSVALNRAIAIAECPDGKVWIGAKEGVLEIANPTDATNSSMTFNHLKVPRNDGSGYADYLLDSEQINSIAVDGSNGKWIGTKTSGLYRVSAAGDQVLEHYTESNSYLPDDMVYAVAADPSSNDVFIATPNGVVKFVSMVAPSSQDLSSVYAYPNPVRPDYTGWIAIRGLMDNTRVKIADAAGNVLLDTVSEGGMVTWDGCNADGRRVRTGVYYVYASNTGEGISSQGAVTKILVVN